MIIRNETDSDIEAITEVTIAAFKTLPISHHTEQFIITALRAANALTISLVAEIDGRVVGHIAFSPVSISDGTPHWYGLGPLSVLPEYQKQGIGTSLVNEGLSLLKGLGGQGCALVGDPNYYKRFGFQIFRIWFMREFRRSSFYPCRFQRSFRKVLLCFTRDSRQKADPT